MKQMRKFLSYFILYYITAFPTVAQERVKYTPLAQAVIEIQKHVGPSDTGPYKTGANEAVYYLHHGKDSLTTITLEEINKLNHLEYDIRLTFDMVYKQKLLKRAIIVEPVNAQRQQKLFNFFQNDPRYKHLKKDSFEN